MRKQEILDKLSAHRAELRERGVKSLEIFGSAARDEAVESSDVDLLVEFDRPTGLLGLINLKHRLEDLLQADEVDLLTPEGLHPALRERIMEEAVHAF
jgi:uncharacterized protein